MDTFCRCFSRLSPPPLPPACSSARVLACRIRFLSSRAKMISAGSVRLRSVRRVCFGRVASKARFRLPLAFQTLRFEVDLAPCWSATEDAAVFGARWMPAAKKVPMRLRRPCLPSGSLREVAPACRAAPAAP